MTKNFKKNLKKKLEVSIKIGIKTAKTCDSWKVENQSTAKKLFNELIIKPYRRFSFRLKNLDNDNECQKIFKKSNFVKKCSIS